MDGFPQMQWRWVKPQELPIWWVGKPSMHSCIWCRNHLQRWVHDQTRICSLHLQILTKKMYFYFKHKIINLNHTTSCKKINTTTTVITWNNNKYKTKFLKEMHGSDILGNEHISYFITILRFAFSFTEIRNVLRIKVNADSVNPNDPSQMTKLLDKVMNFPNSITFFFTFLLLPLRVCGLVHLNCTD